jgi:exosome complex RNA-binding protein Csl4
MFPPILKKTSVRKINNRNTMQNKHSGTVVAGHIIQATVVQAKDPEFLSTLKNNELGLI